MAICQPNLVVSNCKCYIHDLVSSLCFYIVFIFTFANTLHSVMKLAQKETKSDKQEIQTNIGGIAKIYMDTGFMYRTFDTLPYKICNLMK